MRIRQSIIALSGLVLSVVLSSLPIEAAPIGSDNSIQIPNFEKVSDELWRGAVPTEMGLKELSADGAKTVIDLRRGGNGVRRESATAQKLGLKYFNIPIGYGSPSIETINSVLKIVRNPEYQPVFVHCRQGADRTGAVVAVYRMLVQDWSFNKAYEDMRQHHFKPWLLSLKHSVKEWEPLDSAVQPKMADKQSRSL